MHSRESISPRCQRSSIARHAGSASASSSSSTVSGRATVPSKSQMISIVIAAGSSYPPLLRSARAALRDQQIEQVVREVHLLIGDFERRREGDDVLVIPTDVEHQPEAAPADVQIAF